MRQGDGAVKKDIDNEEKCNDDYEKTNVLDIKKKRFTFIWLIILRSSCGTCLINVSLYPCLSILDYCVAFFVS